MPRDREKEKIWNTVGPALQRLERQINSLRDENVRLDKESKDLKLEVFQLERIIGKAICSCQN